MRPRHASGHIRPQISTMPRQKTEAAAYLDIYKLVTERARLQQELETLEQRRDRIEKRLEVLNHQVADLEKSAQQLRDSTTAQPPTVKNQTTASDSFNTFCLEY